MGDHLGIGVNADLLLLLPTVRWLAVPNSQPARCTSKALQRVLSCEVELKLHLPPTPFTPSYTRSCSTPPSPLCTQTTPAATRT